MIKAKTKNIPLTLDLRDRVKSIIESELSRLPELLDKLNDKERLDAILKLMPLVMPRAKPVHYAANEPFDWTDSI